MIIWKKTFLEVWREPIKHSVFFLFLFPVINHRVDFTSVIWNVDLLVNAFIHLPENSHWRWKPICLLDNFVDLFFFKLQIITKSKSSFIWLPEILYRIKRSKLRNISFFFLFAVTFISFIRNMKIFIVFLFHLAFHLSFLFHLFCHYYHLCLPVYFQCVGISFCACAK